MGMDMDTAMDTVTETAMGLTMATDIAMAGDTDMAEDTAVHTGPMRNLWMMI